MHTRKKLRKLLQERTLDALINSSCRMKWKRRKKKHVNKLQCCQECGVNNLGRRVQASQSLQHR
jgi:hypothetical protein